jgi:hypothetical protein
MREIRSIAERRRKTTLTAVMIHPGAIPPRFRSADFLSLERARVTAGA